MINRMGPSTIQQQENFISVRNHEHPGCIICGAGNGLGLQLDFHITDSGSVAASFSCNTIFQGYPGLLHGGIIALLLDGAMTNCLFAHGKVGVTGELTIKFVQSVVVERFAFVKAWITKSFSSLYLVEAELSQGGKILAKASGKFMDRSYNSAKEVTITPTK